MNSDLLKAERSEVVRLEEVLSKQEKRIRAAFDEFLTDSTSESTMRKVRQLLESGNITGALNVIGESITTFGDVIPQIMQSAATAEAKAIAASSGISAEFDPTNESAAKLIESSRLGLIKDFTASQRDATRQALADAHRRGASTQQAAQAFKNSIGLTSTQLDAVQNYRNLLEQGSADALDRALRDKRYDATVSSAVDSGDVLGSSQIDRMVARYQDNLLTARAETIARTESLRATSAARHEALVQIAEDAGIDDDQIKRTWHATKDTRTRHTHKAMNGQTVVGLDTPFTSPSGEQLMYPGDPDGSAEEVINCRCAVSHKISS
jgi:uncharacterized protein with gpF-like domain